jgi:cell division protein FtsB
VNTPRSENAIERRRRLYGNWTEEERAEEESRQYRQSVAILRLTAEIENLLAEIEKLSPAPGTTAQLAALAARRTLSRQRVHQLRDEGLSIRQTAARLGFSQGYVSELRRET